MCDESPLSTKYSSRCYSLSSSDFVHRILLPQKGGQCRLLSLSSSSKNQLPCEKLSHLLHYPLKRGFLLLFFSFLLSLPINLTLYGHIWHTCCTCPWRKLYSCIVSFLRRLILEPSLLDQVSLVSCFCSTLYSRTNGYDSWSPWIPSLICWNCKRLSRVCNLQ